MIEKHVEIYRPIFLGTVGTVVQLLKLRGFEGRKVAQCWLERIMPFFACDYAILLLELCQNYARIMPRIMQPTNTWGLA